MNGRMEYGRKRCGLCGINGFNIDKISLSYYGENTADDIYLGYKMRRGLRGD